MAYYIPDEFITPPPPDHLIKTIYIKHVELRGKMVQALKYERLQSSLLAEYLISTHQSDPQVIDRLMTISFKQEHRDIPDYSQEVLKRGVVLSGGMFRFLGQSNSQLKEKTCYLMEGTDEEIHDVLAQFADFSKIPSTAKRAKRIGLLFSSFNKSVSLHEGEYKIIQDIQTHQYNFTDGCGFMSEEFAREIKRVHKLDHVPSVVQIRYQGYKGVLVHLPELTGLRVQFRKSMQKFTIPDDIVRRKCSTFGVVECSKPYSKAFLNTQLTMILADNGTPRSYLLELQSQFYEMLKNMCNDKEEALRYLTITGNEKKIGRFKSGLFNDTQLQSELARLRNEEIKKMSKEDVNSSSRNQIQGATKMAKLRVLVPKARVVFGVCDPYEELEYGEVFFQPSLPEGELYEFSKSEHVIVGRNPCYHPGDVRVLKLVHAEDKLRYIHLYDCVVFPTKGKRPHPDECSGGDLDGDKFFVSWDKHLIPVWKTNPFNYDEKPAPDIPAYLGKFLSTVFSPVSKGVTSFGRAHVPSIFGTEEQAVHNKKISSREELLKYFATFNNDLVSRVDRVFMKYASKHGASCGVCVYLNKYFSDAVDMVANKKAIEQELELLEKDFRRRVNTQWHTTCQSRQIIRQKSRPPPAQGNTFNQFITYLQTPTKEPFQAGRDDVWSTMENIAEDFVQRMKHLYRIS